MANISNGTEDFTTFRSSIKLGSESEHFNRVSQYLRDDYNGKRSLCDLDIKYANGTENAHSQVVSAFSRRTFEKSLYSCTTIPFEVDNDKINRKAIRNVLSWIYNGKADFKLGYIHAELEFIKLLDVPELQEEVETRLRELSKNGRAVEVLISISRSVKFIPHSYTIEIPCSDKTVQAIVEDLYNLVSLGLPHRKFLRFTPESVMVMIASNIDDSKKVDMINLALRWIYESKVGSEVSTRILRTLTFGAMTYEMLLNFRNSLVQTAIPVRRGKCVRILMKENNQLDIIFGKETDMTCPDSGSQSTKSSSFVMSSETAPPTNNERKDAGKEITLKPFTDSEFEYINALANSGENVHIYKGFDDIVERDQEPAAFSESDCNTAISFSFTDLKVKTFILP